MNRVFVPSRFPPAPEPAPAAVAAVPPAPVVPGVPWWLPAAWLAALLATVAMLFTAQPGSLTAALAWTGVLLPAGLTIVSLVTEREDRRFALHLFTAAFLARYTAAVMVLCIMAWAGATVLEGGKDYLGYEANSWFLAENWRAGRAVFTVADKDPGYYYVVAGVYTLTGRFVIAPTLLNAFFGALAAVVTFLLGKELFDRRTGVIAGMLAAFIPTLLLWSSLLYKDTILACAMTWGFYLAVREGRRHSRLNAWGLGLSILPVFMMRPESAVTLGTVVVFLVVLTGRVGFRRVVRVGVALGFVVLLMLGLDLVGLGGKATAFGRFMNPFSTVFVHRESWADVVSSNVTGFSRFLYGRNLLLEPHLLVVATALPFLLPIPGSGSFGINFGTFLLPGQLVWLPLLPMMGYGVLWVLRNRTPERLALLAFVTLTAVGVALAGYFSNPRYLVQVVPLLLLFAALGIRHFSRWWVLYGIVAAGAASVMVMYLVAKGG